MFDIFENESHKQRFRNWCLTNNVNFRGFPEFKRKPTIYRNPYEPHGVLRGFTGQSFMEAGYVYAPYIPMTISPTVEYVTTNATLTYGNVVSLTGEVTNDNRVTLTDHATNTYPADLDDFHPRRELMTRYATAMVRPEFYGTINIGDEIKDV